MTPEAFFKNFAYLANAPNGVKKLRELILQLAVRGKLVPQDSNNEPAVQLFEQIQVDKTRLVKEKKIRKAEPLPPVSANEVPYELPQGWGWFRIGDISLEITGGGTPSKQNPEYWNGNIPWASVKDLGKGKYINTTIDRISAKGLQNSSSNLIPAGRVIVCTRMGLGKIVINKIDISINQDLKALTISDKIEIDYFYNYYLTQNILGSGVTVSGIKQDELLSIPIPLPPLAEQHRIVAKVDQLMSLCDVLEIRQQKKLKKLTRLNNAALDRLTTARKADDFTAAWQLVRDNFDLLYTTPETTAKLRQCILQLAVQGKLVPQDPNDEPASALMKRIKAEKERLVKEKKIRKSDPLPPVAADEMPYELPQGWEWAKIDEICFVTKLAGFEYTKHINLEPKGEVPVIRAQNVKRGRIDDTNLLYIDFKTSHLLDRCSLTKPSILMTFIGAGIGDVAIFDKKERWHLAPNVAKLEPYNNYGVHVDIKYLHYYLMSDSGRNEIFKFSKATAQPSLSMGTIREIIIAMPPYSVQKRIVSKVEQFMTLCDFLESRLKKALFKADILTASTVKSFLAA